MSAKLAWSCHLVDALSLTKPIVEIKYTQVRTLRKKGRHVTRRRRKNKHYTRQSHSQLRPQPQPGSMPVTKLVTDGINLVYWILIFFIALIVYGAYCG